MKAIRLWNDDGTTPDMTGCLLTLAKYCPDAWEMAMQIEIIFNENVPRAATDSVRVYFQRSFWDILNDSQRAFVIAHEVLHIWLAHGQRGKFYALQGFFNSKLPWHHGTYNDAADFIINAYLIRCGLQAAPDICLSDKYNGHELTDEVYVELMAERFDGNEPPPEEPDGPEGQPGDPADGPEGQPGDPADGPEGQPGEPTDGDTSGGTPAPKPTPSSGHDQHFEPQYEGTDEEQAAAAENDQADIQRKVDDVIDSAKADGRTPPGCSDSAASGYRHRGHNVRHSGTPWTQKLAHVLNRASNRGGRQNWGKIHRRRLISTGVLTPTKKGRINLIALTEDISGSVSETAREKLHREAAYLLDTLRPVRGMMILFTNTRVVDTAEVRTGVELLNVEVPHGGGTRMHRSIEYMQDRGIRPDVHLIFTDGEMSAEDYAKCKANGSILILDSMPSWMYGDRLRESGCEYIIID